MKIIDPGHTYELSRLDGHGVETLRFVKREGEKFPGNVGSYSGTNCQEVLRVLINRCEYLNDQIQCAETESIIHLLNTSLFLFEVRAARRSGRSLSLKRLDGIRVIDCCPVCGHIQCTEHEQPAGKEWVNRDGRWRMEDKQIVAIDEQQELTSDELKLMAETMDQTVVMTRRGELPKTRMIHLPTPRISSGMKKILDSTPMIEELVVPAVYFNEAISIASTLRHSMPTDGTADLRIKALTAFITDCNRYLDWSHNSTAVVRNVIQPRAEASKTNNPKQFIINVEFFDKVVQLITENQLCEDELTAAMLCPVEGHRAKLATEIFTEAKAYSEFVAVAKPQGIVTPQPQEVTISRATVERLYRHLQEQFCPDDIGDPLGDDWLECRRALGLADGEDLPPLVSTGKLPDANV